MKLEEDGKMKIGYKCIKIVIACFQKLDCMVQVVSSGCKHESNIIIQSSSFS